MIKTYAKYSWDRYRSLHIYGKVFIWLVIMTEICMGVFVVIVTPARIAQYSYDKARLLAATPFGWLVLGLIIVCISFPPFVGHTTLITLSGFAYGIQGFFLNATASLLGSALTFVILRHLFSERLNRWSSQNQNWQALESVVKEKGLPLIILIRISPFPPWVYSNSLFASIQAVKLWQFAIATLFVFPRLLLYTFIGSKMASLADGNQRELMDNTTKILNGMLIGGGFAVAIGTSGWLYALVQRHIRHLRGIPAEIDESAAEAIEDFDEDAPLLSSREA